jgi:hypothetical protein
MIINLITPGSEESWQASLINRRIERAVLSVFTGGWLSVSITHPWVVGNWNWCSICRATWQETNIMHQPGWQRPAFIACIQCVNKIRCEFLRIMASRWLMLNSIVGADVSKLVMSMCAQCVCSRFIT